jgi:mono/diheme cytochrome c family protein
MTAQRDGTRRVAGRAWLGPWIAGLVLALAAPGVAAQNINNGFALYNAILVPGNPNCASGGCHGPDPTMNQNKIQNGDEPGGIAYAIATVSQMAFLRGRLSTAQLADLAAYIANPGGVTAQPAISVSPASVDFGSVAVGAIEVRAITLQNTGAADLVVSSIGTSGPPFSVSAPGCATLAPAQSCTVNVRFAPGATGSVTGTLSVLHNAAGSPSTVALGGRGAQGVASIEPASLDFGAVWLGTVTAPLTARVVNRGDAPLTLGTIAASSTAFEIAGGDCHAGLQLAPEASCTVRVRYRAPIAGSPTATLTVQHDGSSGPASAALFATARPLPPDTRLMVEFRFAPLDYYFISSRPEEQLLLDGVAGFERTGESFPVHTMPLDGRTALSRYFFAEIARNRSRGSHFYTAIDAEKEVLLGLNPGNQALPRLPFNEGVEAYVRLPAASAVPCPGGFLPVWRLFRGNERFPDDPNHRFVVKQSLYDAFRALGWDGEGVRFCVPAE